MINLSQLRENKTIVQLKSKGPKILFYLLTSRQANKALESPKNLEAKVQTVVKDKYWQAMISQSRANPILWVLVWKHVLCTASMCLAIYLT